MRRVTYVLVASLTLAAAPSAQNRRDGGLRPGDVAPDFTLEPRGGGAPVTLAAFRDSRPVALVFGSYT